MITPYPIGLKYTFISIPRSMTYYAYIILLIYLYINIYIYTY